MRRTSGRRVTPSRSLMRSDAVRTEKWRACDAGFGAIAILTPCGGIESEASGTLAGSGKLVSVWETDKSYLRSTSTLIERARGTSRSAGKTRIGTASPARRLSAA